MMVLHVTVVIANQCMVLDGCVPNVMILTSVPSATCATSIVLTMSL